MSPLSSIVTHIHPRRDSSRFLVRSFVMRGNASGGVNDRSFSVSFVILGLLKERISFEQSGQQDGDEEETVRVRAFSSRVQRAVQCILGFNMRRHVNTNEKRTVDEPTEVEQGAAMSTPVQR